MNALLSGQGAAATGNPFDTAGRELWNAAVASEKRLPGFEDTPTFAELGHPELNKAAMWRGFAVKKGTPDDVVKTLCDAFEKAAASDSFVEYMNNAGQVIDILDSEAFGAKMESENALYKDLLTQLGLSIY